MADGQVTMGGMVVKPNVKKTRKIGDHCIGGFAGGRAEKERIFRSARRHPSTALLSVAASVSRQQHCQERRHRRRCRWCRAGATADAFTLFERLEAKLEEHPGEGSSAGYSSAGGLQPPEEPASARAAGHRARHGADLFSASRTGCGGRWGAGGLRHGPPPGKCRPADACCGGAGQDVAHG